MKKLRYIVPLTLFFSGCVNAQGFFGGLANGMNQGMTSGAQIRANEEAIRSIRMQLRAKSVEGPNLDLAEQFADRRFLQVRNQFLSK